MALIATIETAAAVPAHYHRISGVVLKEKMWFLPVERYASHEARESGAVPVETHNYTAIPEEPADAVLKWVLYRMLKRQMPDAVDHIGDGELSIDSVVRYMTDEELATYGQMAADAAAAEVERRANEPDPEPLPEEPVPDPAEEPLP